MRFFNGVKRFLFLVAIIVVALIAVVMILPERIERVTDRITVPDRPETRPREKAFTSKTPVRSPSEAERRRRPIAVIIDDIGYDLRLVEQLVRIGAPLAFAILPRTPHAVEAARLLHGAGKEILLHMPMEPRSYPAENPGAGALFTHMSDEEIRERIETDIAAVPYILGVNNHMGSRFMEDEAKLFVVMKVLAKRGLFFVDSRTTPDSRGRAAATRAGVRFLERAAFIDHPPGYATALANLIHPPRQEWEKRRPLLLIGHPFPGTVRALKEASSLWQNEGVRIIPVSACFNRPDGKEETGTLATKR
jgi:polysaccharide deacetylase 2 family uncharacterized protein YibQ